MVEFASRSAFGVNYRLYVPPGYDGSPCPSILFLHGRGESGSDNVRQTETGLGAAIRQAPEKWPFLVVMPQKLDPEILWPAYASHLDAVLQDVESAFTVDGQRCYLTGLSQGGNGTFALAAHLRWRFAAVAPVCGWADPMQVAWDLRATPTWIFHGDADPVIPASASRAIADFMPRHGGGQPKMTIYPGVDHNSWDRAYQEEKLAEWFLSHRLG